MRCHECVREGHDSPALGLCRSCLVGLCKDHLVRAARAAAPQYGCQHRPDLEFASSPPSGKPRPAEAASTMPRPDLRRMLAPVPS